MITTPYERGRHKEYRIIKRYKAQGWDIAVRTAGSHSPFDIIAINMDLKQIHLIQSKLTINQKNKDKLMNENINLNNMFEVSFIVI